jgi:hypothetical protein
VDAVLTGAGHAAAPLLVFVLTIAWRVLTFSGFSNDHYVHFARAQQMLLGDWPLRDFVDPGLLLMYAASAGAWRIWGGSLGTEVVLVAFAFALGAACTVHVSRRLSGSLAIALLVTLVEVMIGPRSYSYPKVVIYAAAAWVIVAVARSASRPRLLLMAGLVAVAFLFRHDHGIYTGVGGTVAVALASRGLGRRVLVNRLAVFWGGVALLLLPWFVYVARYQGVVDYFRSGVEFSRAEAVSTYLRSWPRMVLTPSRGLVGIRPPYRPVAVVEWAQGISEATRRDLERRYQLDAAPAYDGSASGYYVRDPSAALLRALADDSHVAGSAGFGDVLEWSPRQALLASLSPSRLELRAGLHLERNSYVFLFYLFHALPLVAIVVVWRRHVRGLTRWPGEDAALGAIAVMAVLVNVGFIRGSLYVWLHDAVVPAALLGAWLLSVAVPSGASRRVVRVAWNTALGLVVWLTLVATAQVGSLKDRFERTDIQLGVDGVKERVRVLTAALGRSHRESGYAPSSVSAGLLPFFAYLDRCTVSQDRLIVTGLYPDVFVMAERGFAGGQLAFMDPFYTSSIEQERTLGRMRRESVPFVLVFLGDEEGFRRGFPLVSGYIDQRYVALVDLPIARTRGVRVLVEKARQALRRDDQTHWPCFR